MGSYSFPYGNPLFPGRDVTCSPRLCGRSLTLPFSQFWLVAYRLLSSFSFTWLVSPLLFFKALASRLFVVLSNQAQTFLRLEMRLRAETLPPPPIFPPEGDLNFPRFHHGDLVFFFFFLFLVPFWGYSSFIFLSVIVPQCTETSLRGLFLFLTPPPSLDPRKNPFPLLPVVLFFECLATIDSQPFLGTSSFPLINLSGFFIGVAPYLMTLSAPSPISRCRLLL